MGPVVSEVQGSAATQMETPKAQEGLLGPLFSA